MHEVVKASEELVVMANAMDLRLRMTQFVHCLHLSTLFLDEIGVRRLRSLLE
jgi:hypothetical protein